MAERVPDAVLQGIEQAHGAPAPVMPPIEGPTAPSSAAPAAGVALDPTGTGPLYPPGAGIAVRVQPVPRDRSALDGVMQSVWMTESGDTHTDKNGAVRRSSAGALGASQLMPSTAKALGVDPMDEGQNREGGKRLLGGLFDRYGNWDDALAAYNWGEGRVDKWVTAGRDPSKMPAETRTYVDTVLRRSGMSETAGTAIAREKRRIGADELNDIEASMRSPRAPASERLTSPFSVGGDPSGFDFGAAGGEQLEALSTGVRRGIQGMVTGPLQAGLEQVAPDQARAMTAKINEFESQFDAITEKHPWLATGGDVIGTTIGVMLAGRLLGPVGGALAARGVIPAFLGRAGLIARSSAAGAAMGATTYNPKPDEASRTVEGAVGGVLGGLGGTLAKSVMWGARTLADGNAYRGFLDTMTKSVSDLTPSTTKLKDAFLQHYEQLWAKKNELYTVRNAAGQEMGEGLPRAEVAAAVTDAMRGSGQAGVAVTPTTRATATAIDRELGGPAARAAEAEHGVAVKDYERALVKAQAERAPFGRQTEAMRREEADGHISPMPTHPGEFEAPPISTEQYSAAMQAVNRAWVRARSDPTTRKQLGDIQRSLTNAAESAAREAGMPVNDFLRRSEEAGRFFRTEIGPIYERFGRKSPAQIRGEADVAFSGIPTAKFFDDAVRLIEGHDMRSLESFARMVGPAARPELTRILSYRMVQQAEGKTGVANVRDYIREHSEAIQTLVGREGRVQLEGMANIAERVAAQPAAHRKLMDLSNHSWLKYLGALEMMEGALHGSGKRMLWGAGLVATPYATHLAFNVLSHIQKVPTVVPLIARASKLRPDSPEMDRVMKEIERRAVTASAVAGREATPAANVGAGAVGMTAR